jgi:pimeloyl-ACP methyl ester carboxylesterase
VPEARVGDIVIHYELTGHGRALVLIPGLGAEVRLFRHAIEGLSHHRQVLAFDPRGAGKSDKPDMPYSIPELADDTLGLMRAVGMNSAHVLGFSMGGRVALELSLRCPEVVTGLILVSTSARTLPYRPLSWRWLVTDVLPRLSLLSRVDPQPRYAHAAESGIS